MTEPDAMLAARQAVRKALSEHNRDNGGYTRELDHLYASEASGIALRALLDGGYVVLTDQEPRLTQLDEIRERLGAATMGTWYAIANTDVQNSGEPRSDAEREDPDQEWVVQLPGTDLFDALGLSYGWLSKQTAELIAHAPDDIAFLLGEVERLTPLSHPRHDSARSELRADRSNFAEVLTTHGWQERFGKWGCDAADAMADALEEAEAELARIFSEPEEPR